MTMKAMMVKAMMVKAMMVKAMMVKTMMVKLRSPWLMVKAMMVKAMMVKAMMVKLSSQWRHPDNFGAHRHAYSQPRANHTAHFPVGVHLRSGPPNLRCL